MSGDLRRRRGRRFARPSSSITVRRMLAVVAVGAFSLSTTTALTAGNTLSPTQVSETVGTVQVDDFAPDECSGMSLSTLVVTVGGLATGTNGNDLILGPQLNDNVAAAGGNDCVLGGAGSDFIRGNQGSDVLLTGLDGDDGRGGGGNDVIYGGSGADDVRGGGGTDTVYGGAGADDVRGNRGNDTLFGGDANDSLDGGQNTDFCQGDAGFDTFNRCETAIQ